MKQPQPTPEPLVAALDENGHEVPDSTPLRLPAGFKRPETLAEQVQRLVRTQLSVQAQDQGFETFDDADDFDVDDELDPHTPYETFFDPVLGKELSPHEFKQREPEYRKRYLEAQRNYFNEMDRMEVVRGGGRRPASPPSEAGGRPPPSKSEPDA